MGILLRYPQAICPAIRVPSEIALLSSTTPLLLHRVPLLLRQFQLTKSSVQQRPPHRCRRQQAMSQKMILRVLPKMILTKCPNISSLAVVLKDFPTDNSGRGEKDGAQSVAHRLGWVGGRPMMGADLSPTRAARNAVTERCQQASAAVRGHALAQTMMALLS